MVSSHERAHHSLGSIGPVLGVKHERGGVPTAMQSCIYFTVDFFRENHPYSAPGYQRVSKSIGKRSAVGLQVGTVCTL